MINSLYLSGRCAADPAIKEGKKSLMLRIAVPRYDSAARQNVDEFFSVWVHGKTAEVVEDQVRSGDRVFVQGYVSMFKREGAKYAEAFLHANTVEFTPKATAKAAPAAAGKQDPDFNPDF